MTAFHGLRNLPGTNSWPNVGGWCGHVGEGGTMGWRENAKMFFDIVKVGEILLL